MTKTTQDVLAEVFCFRCGSGEWFILGNVPPSYVCGKCMRKEADKDD